MKKVLALLSIVALASCGNTTSTDVKTDSTAVVTDTTLTDSIKVPVDSTKVDSLSAK